MPAILITDISIGDDIQCSLYSEVNGSTSIVGKVAGIIIPSALPVDSTAPADHINIYPALPDSVKSKYDNDYRSYNYLAILAVDGHTSYIGLPWIVEASLIRSDLTYGTVTLANFRDVDAASIKALLQANGYVVVDVTTSVI